MTRSHLQVPIESVPIGSRVSTKNPNRFEVDPQPEPDQATWAKVSITVERSDGGIVDAEIIRPRSWILRNGICAGRMLPFNLPELEVSGLALVTAIEDCPPIAGGEGSVVTARFVTREVRVVASVDVLGADGTVETITGTTIHPVWSVDRQKRVPLAGLAQGERLQGLDGLAVVLSVTLSRVSQPVYNIEVHGEHVYQVGELGLVVHNPGGLVCGNSYFAQFGKLKHKRYMSEVADQVTKIKEFVLPSGRRVDFIDIANEFVYELKPNNSRAIAKGMSQLRGYIDELKHMPEFSHITNWKGILDVY